MANRAMDLPMKVGSLFAGVGGFDIAAERAGMEVAWQSENDPKASGVLEHHWPGLNLGDIHDIRIRRDESGGDPGSLSVVADREGLRRLHPDNDGGIYAYKPASAVDVLCGGFPCQDYSVAGNREGLAGDRGALWWQFHRLIGEGRPTWVVAENVPGLLSSRDGADFATIIDSLTEYGYGVAWGVLDAQWFGVAQRRRRVFIVAHSGGEPRPEILALSEGLYGHPQPSRQEGPVASSLTTSSVGGRGGPDDNAAQANHLIAFSAGQSDKAGSLGAAVELAPTIRGGASGTNQVPTIAFPQNQRDEVRDLNDLAGALAAEPGMKQQTYVAYPDPVPVLRAGQGGTWDPQKYNSVAFSQTTVRRLTPLECERLQGFPDGWTDIEGNSDSQRYRQMGNAVAVPVVEWIMKRIVAL